MFSRHRHHPCSWVLRTALAILTLCTAAAGQLMGNLSLTGPTTLTQCEDATFNWVGGIPPYNVSWVAYSSSISLLGDPAAIAAGVKWIVTSYPEASYTWKVDAPAQSILFMVSSTDTSVDQADFKLYSVKAGTDTSCLSANGTTSQNLTPSSTSPDGTASRVTTGPGSAMSTSVHSSGTATASPGHSTGEIVGIAVGSAVGGLLLAFAVGLCVYIRRRRARANPPTHGPGFVVDDDDLGPMAYANPVVSPFIDSSKGRAPLDGWEQGEHVDRKGMLPTPMSSSSPSSSSTPWQSPNTSTYTRYETLLQTQIPRPLPRQPSPPTASSRVAPVEPPTIIEHEVDGGPVVPRRELLPPLYNPQWSKSRSQSGSRG